MAKMAIVVCDSASEEAQAMGYWTEQKYELLEDAQEINKLMVFEENAGPQEKWVGRYEGKGSRVLIFLKKK